MTGFKSGDWVRVSDDAEFYIGCTATVSASAFQGETFGYNVHLAGTGIPAWIPAKDLAATRHATDALDRS